MTRDKITQLVEHIIERLDETHWEKPWTELFAGAQYPINATTEQPYRGINTLMGLVVSMTEGYDTNLWATYRQWSEIGAQVRKGEKGTPMMRWGQVVKCATCEQNGCDIATHERSRRTWVKRFTVFNAAQVDGYEYDTGSHTTERIEDLEKLISATGATINHKVINAAHFIPAVDEITVPNIEQFPTAGGYYSTLLHELGHWTGPRLGRVMSHNPDEYAYEELVAEFVAVFLAAEYGIELAPSDNHAAYIGTWMRRLTDDPSILYRAAADAERACGYIRNPLDIDTP